MRHSEIHKFCDATLNRVLEGLKSYNNDVKYDYIQRDLNKDELEYLKLFEEEIEVRLKYRNQMRRWEMTIEGTKAHEEEGDMDVDWDITSKDVERLREKEQDYDIPLNDSIMQPLTPQMVHITPPDDDYVAPATNHMSNKQLNKFKEEFSNITRAAEKEYDNPVIKTYDMRPSFGNYYTK
ncbi:hypothetical protein Tco_0591213 [Tanacetum coccineum]